MLAWWLPWSAPVIAAAGVCASVLGIFVKNEDSARGSRRDNDARSKLESQLSQAQDRVAAAERDLAITKQNVERNSRTTAAVAAKVAERRISPEDKDIIVRHLSQVPKCRVSIVVGPTPESSVFGGDIKDVLVTAGFHVSATHQIYNWGDAGPEGLLVALEKPSEPSAFQKTVGNGLFDAFSAVRIGIALTPTPSLAVWLEDDTDLVVIVGRPPKTTGVQDGVHP